MKFARLELFPTIILNFDLTDIFDQSELDLMRDVIEEDYVRGDMIDQNMLVVKTQSKPYLFTDQAHPIFHKLRETFVVAARTYLQEVPHFCTNQENIQFTKGRAWWYRSSAPLYNSQAIPWHNHLPAFLSGVFYVSIPGNQQTAGTIFCDPKVAPGQGIIDQAIEARTAHWAIFPGWLQHKSGVCDVDDPRYVVAADIYAAT